MLGAVSRWVGVAMLLTSASLGAGCEKKSGADQGSSPLPSSQSPTAAPTASSASAASPKPDPDQGKRAVMLASEDETQWEALQSSSPTHRKRRQPRPSSLPRKPSAGISIGTGPRTMSSPRTPTRPSTGE